ncbi:hypothetical protein [Bremerella cremea]|uniref:hypothetical protein n=1 Tax=Bremerella cremea TaxID=1031537 RepID=UPI000DF2E9D9|nr:hypothetical protein [Bremerella cremea]
MALPLIRSNRYDRHNHSEIPLANRMLAGPFLHASCTCQHLNTEQFDAAISRIHEIPDPHNSRDGSGATVGIRGIQYRREMVSPTQSDG